MTTQDPGPGALNQDDGNAYDLLAEDHDEGHRWAFGTGFTDPLEGVDTSVPDGLDPGERVGEPGSVGPAVVVGVLVGEPAVRVVVFGTHHMCGTSSGMS